MGHIKDPEISSFNNHVGLLKVVSLEPEGVNLSNFEKFWMVDIEINVWSPLFLNLEIK